MNKLKFVEVDKDKFIRLDEIKGFFRKDEIILTGDYKKPSKDYSYGVVAFSDGSKSEIPIEYFEKLKKAVLNDGGIDETETT